MKSTEIIQAEIAKLISVIELVPSHNGWGDNNRASIDAQIQVLIERLTAEDVHESWSDDAVHEEEYDEAVYLDALYASDWMYDQLSEDCLAPSIDWTELAKRGK